MYKIEYTKGDYIAKVVHSERVIKLGLQFRNLNLIQRMLVLEHEKAHEFDKCNEIEADKRAVLSVAKKTKNDVVYIANNLIPYRSKTYVLELINEIKE